MTRSLNEILAELSPERRQVICREAAQIMSELNATQVRRLPPEERNRILSEVAQLAIGEYQPSSELIEFTQDLAEDDIYGYK